MTLRKKHQRSVIITISATCERNMVGVVSKQFLKECMENEKTGMSDLRIEIEKQEEKDPMSMTRPKTTQLFCHRKSKAKDTKTRRKARHKAGAICRGEKEGSAQSTRPPCLEQFLGYIKSLTRHLDEKTKH